MNQGMARPQVLIRTRPLGEGNYGGILQAFAMQRVLLSMGIEPITDTSRGDASLGPVKRVLRFIVSSGKRLLVRLGPRGLVRQRWVSNALRAERDRELSRFVRDELCTVEVFDRSGVADQVVLGGPDGFLVGSDQVWRAAYGRVPGYLLDMLAATDPRPRVAYAASFGTDDPREYSPELAAETKILAQRFSAISVREDSGIRLAKELWGVGATLVLDPTLLLTRHDYIELCSRAVPFVPENSFVHYVLDRNPSVLQRVDEVASILDGAGYSLLPPDPLSISDFRERPELYARPSIEQWLGAIAHSRFIVTDSFHGTVFAIIFNTPFVTVVNESRGAARFHSVLKLFGLENRAVARGNIINPELVGSRIDWEDVNARLMRYREDSVHFLKTAMRDLLLDADLSTSESSI